MKPLIIITLTILLSCAGLQAADYKSVVDSYPQLAKEAGIIQLGKTIEIDGYLYRVMGECKSVVEDIWIQFIDTTVPGPIDNDPDFAARIVLYENELIMVDVYEIDAGIEIIKAHCEKHNIEMKGFIHFADPVKIPNDNEI